MCTLRRQLVRGERAHQSNENTSGTAKPSSRTEKSTTDNPDYSQVREQTEKIIDLRTGASQDDLPMLNFVMWKFSV